jgi:glycosyltransferase involved in cell wall biosynthesis
MLVTVAIPTFNSAATIRMTLDSVLSQNCPPFEILVLDDGSTDNTVSVVRNYAPCVKLFRQQNQGVASARNALVRLARGDLLAFLDHDDVWHPRYLEAQTILARMYPQAVALYTGHANFSGTGSFEWGERTEADFELDAKLLETLDFFREYNTRTGPFASMSWCCVPKSTFEKLGDEPFKVSGVDDSYFATQLPLLGPVAFTPLQLAAYRFTLDSQSANKLKAFGLWVSVFQLLAPRYQKCAKRLRSAFFAAYASKQRQYAKFLIGAGRIEEGRTQLWSSVKVHAGAASVHKSLALLLLTYFPRSLQPTWPPEYRQ